MAQQQGPEQSLENQLRDMMLGNVRIGNEPSQQQFIPGAHHDQRMHHGFRGRGDGRPPHWFGRGRGRGDHTNGFQRQEWHEQRQFPDDGQRPHHHHHHHRGGGGGHFHGRPQGDDQSVTRGMESPRGFGGHRHGHHAFDRQNGYQNMPQSPNQIHPQANGFHRGNGHGFPQSPGRGHHGGGGVDLRVTHLDTLAAEVLPSIQMSMPELDSKTAFLHKLEAALQAVQASSEEPQATKVSLQTFGSLRSGFATAGSDMDLVIVDESDSQAPAQVSLHESGLPRRFEKHLLDAGIGARLLSRARVPIIKVCEQPPEELLQGLRTAREQWDALPDDEKYEGLKEKKVIEEPLQQEGATEPNLDTQIEEKAVEDKAVEGEHVLVPPVAVEAPEESQPAVVAAGDSAAAPSTQTQDQHPSLPPKPQQQQQQRPWTRKKKKGPLDFPDDGVGIQTDINFFNPLGLHNTRMLYCYALCDDRVRPMVLFVKAWARKRKINASYSGTLSSYGHVLMVLHYLVNVARPPVLPNLQLEAQRAGLPAKVIEGWKVSFWDDAERILQYKQAGTLTQNRESIGSLLKGFFQYYAASGQGFGFMWVRDVISLRSQGGIVSKGWKQWTGAKTETLETREVRHRYLLAIEDPFELTHNVGRTVTHRGIVAIRDEFRRAWRILGAVGNGVEPHDGNLLDELVEAESPEDVKPGAREADEQKSQAEVVVKIPVV